MNNEASKQGCPFWGSEPDKVEHEDGKHEYSCSNKECPSSEVWYYANQWLNRVST